MVNVWIISFFEGILPFCAIAESFPTLQLFLRFPKLDTALYIPNITSVQTKSEGTLEGFTYE